MTKKEREKHIEELRKNVSYILEIPEWDRNDLELVKVQRELGRYIKRMGYDVLNLQFFVEEKLPCLQKDGTEDTCSFYNTFISFGDYYQFVQGKVYENACYFGYIFSDEEISKFNLDLSKMNFVSLVDETIDNFEFPINNETHVSEDAEKWRSILEEYTHLLSACTSPDDIKKLVDEYYEKSRLLKKTKAWGWDSITPLILKWVSNQPDKCISMFPNDFLVGYYRYENVMKVLALLFEEIMMRCIPTHRQIDSGKKKRNELEIAVRRAILKEKIVREEKGYDDILDVYYIKKNIYSDGKKFCTYATIYDTFPEFVVALSGDLSDCNLRLANLDGVDLSQYFMNEKTIIGAKYLDYQPELRIGKGYSKESRLFRIEYGIFDRNNNMLQYRDYRYKYFFDFLHVVKNDLTDCHLLYCDGLEHVPNLSQYHADKAKIRSQVLIKAGYSATNIERYKYSITRKISFEQSEKNEDDAFWLYPSRKDEFDEKSYMIYYISDLHLHHKLKRRKRIRNLNDIEYEIFSWVNSIISSKQSEMPIVIAGDICHEKTLYQTFLKLLSRRTKNIIVIPGNHELWEMSSDTWREELIAYQKYVEQLGMSFLQNCILYKLDGDKEWRKISEEEIGVMSIQEMREKTRYARFIFFGGLGFSGYQPDFNATNGLYCKTITTFQDDLKETKKFETLYRKVEQCFFDREVVVATHMPLDNWLENPEYHKGWIYINGHTHRNYFEDDGYTRIYADNQLGYDDFGFSIYKLKYVLLNGEYDIFEDYEDGIYPITPEEYLDFAKGKNIQMKYNRTDYDIYMLKKRGYYCFFAVSQKNGSLYLLDGGIITNKNLKSNDIQYYYEHMEEEIELLKTPLLEYYAFQKQISDAIKWLGGSGKIHGCIIDIDKPLFSQWSMNHIYLDPEDLTPTCYWASNVVNKKVYQNLSSLLKYECPELYEEYRWQITHSGESSTALVLYSDNQKISPETITYTDTDMYRTSRKFKSLQYLIEKKVLRKWYDFSDESKKQIMENIPRLE